MAQAAVDKWGRIDYLINNAARTKFNPFPQMDGVNKQDFLDIYAVNVVGPYQMIRAVEPHMRKTGGAIVNDSSIGGVTGIASSIPYAASKAALNLMTKSLAHVLGPEIRINTVVPGMIQTRWLKGGLGDDDYEKLLAATAEGLPLKKVATAEEVAEVLVWFLFGASVVTGETLIVDSGLHLGPFPPYASGRRYVALMSTAAKVDAIKARLSVPAFAAPMFIISGPDLTIEACKAGVIGAFPTLNARPVAVLEEWFQRINAELAAAEAANPGKVAPWAANLIVHKNNRRFDPDFELIMKYQPEIVITSLGSPARVADEIHSYGGLVFSDVNSVEFAHKAAERGADGLILIAEGAGGHTGFMPAEEFIAEVRDWYDGPAHRRRRHQHRAGHPPCHRCGRRLRLHGHALYRHRGMSGSA